MTDETLVQALAKAQGEMPNPPLDGVNPHFKSKFSTLKAVVNVVVPALAKHGISVTQTYGVSEIFGQYMLTRLSKGAEVIDSIVPLPAYANPQQWSSASTYIRRVSLLGIACTVGDPDEDANEASKPEHAKPEVDPELSFKAAVKMRELLDADVEERIKALHCLDYHDVLNKDQPLYEAASQELKPRERAAWKVYVKQAKTAEKEDTKVMAAGRKF